MTLTVPEPDTAVAPITDAAGWLQRQPPGTQSTLASIAELLAGVAATVPPQEERAEAFTARQLDMPTLAGVVVEERELGGVTALSTGLALAEWMRDLPSEVGPFRYTDAPAWGETTVAESVYAYPMTLRAAFPAGTAAAVPLVIAFNARRHDRPSVAAYARPGDREAARTALSQLAERAQELNPLRGRVLRATYSAGLAFEVTDLPAVSRDTVIVPDAVWTELDLGVKAVRDSFELLNEHGLGCRRGVMLVGPPGTGKSAVSAVVAKTLVAEGFTAVFVEGRGGPHLLTEVVEEIQRTLSPAVVILEDVDLHCRDRRDAAAGALAELLRGMDIRPEARILTIASTNSIEVLDKASIRTGRFDSIVGVPYPDRAACVRILDVLLAGLPGGDAVDTAAVGAALPGGSTAGSDLRELVRRAVLSDDGVSTEALIAEIGSGRYRAEIVGGAGGNYL